MSPRALDADDPIVLGWRGEAAARRHDHESRGLELLGGAVPARLTVRPISNGSWRADEQFGSSPASSRAWEAGHPLPRYATIHHAIVPPNKR